MLRKIHNRFFKAVLSTLVLVPTLAVAQTRLNPVLPDFSSVLNPASTDGKTGREWAVVLGKALFWDQLAGSDGVACASCHYNAGADIRLQNQLSPGVHDISFSQQGDVGFGATRSDTGLVNLGDMPSGAVAAPNYTLTAQDFPLFKLQNETQRNSAITTATNDIVSSQGAFATDFQSVNAVSGRETCGPAHADVFHVNGIAGRQVALRNSQTTINSVFNRRALWDGSANNLFNGVGSFGLRDIQGNPNLRLIVAGATSQPELTHLELPNSALASQAVGPIVNNVEMSCRGRTLRDVGRKLMASNVRPLMQQDIAPTDSVLAGLIDATGKGLATQHNYKALVQKAFAPEYWNLAGRFNITDGALVTVRGRGGYSQMEHNWSMFWGLAIMLYEATLISNSSEFDQLLFTGQLTVRDIRSGPPFGCEGGDDVDPLLLRGCKIFFQSRDASTSPPGAGCNGCHGGRDLFTNAARQPNQDDAPLLQIGSVLDEPGTRPGMVDLGFQNTGVRPTFSDLKLGGVDPYGNPLSYARQYHDYLVALDNGRTQEEALAETVLDPDLKDAILRSDIFTTTANSITSLSKIHVAGAAKSPTLRNIALTPPYTSAGIFSNLRQMIQFYNRDTSRRTIAFSGDANAMGAACASGDSSGTGASGLNSYDEMTQSVESCHTNVIVGLGQLELSDCELNGTNCDPASDDIAALIRFLESLTDPSVQCDLAPFDHPSLRLTIGHRPTDNNGDGKLDDRFFVLPAVGAQGYDPTSGFCIPNSGDLFTPGMQARAGGARVGQ